MNKLKLGIVGHGFVGKAVEFGFLTPQVEIFKVDPKYNTTLDDLVAWEPNIVFVCAPTPMKVNGHVDATIVEDAVLQCIKRTKAGVVLKSTITPSVADRIAVTLAHESPETEEEKREKCPDYLTRFAYNPEFLTENNANDQFVNPEYMILGGVPEATAAILNLYYNFSNINFLGNKVFQMNVVEAAFCKYAINTFLATKVTFFNNLYDEINAYGGGYNVIMRAVSNDSRVGPSHTKVPGFDGKRGFGGACFPKDLAAFIGGSDRLPLLESVMEINNKYRQQYELDDREKEQHVTYGQTEEDQQDQDNGSSV